MSTTHVVTHTTVCGLHFAYSEGTIYPLTPCCQASATGSFVQDTPATVCRACYTPVSPVYGVSGTTRPPQVSWLVDSLAQGDCPDPVGCAVHTIWHLTGA
ncbi:MAG: hypothetical protein L0H93_23520 [Nocardioides sp.]|nr:hypothetical protein [Nocardioides sp.]